MSPQRPRRRRLDQRLVDEGLAVDLREAAGLVLAGRVMVGEEKIDKAGAQVAADRPLRLVGGRGHGYVSRGGVKLAGALDALGLDVSGLRCVDVGASTGGFTDCLLGRGAAAVAAVDVGHGLLADRLRRDERVIVMERTHARELRPEGLPWLAELVTVDVSFIGLAALLPALTTIVTDTGRILAMVKPQFEAGRGEVEPGGVVRDAAIRRRVVDEVAEVGRSLGWRVEGESESTLPGPKGNIEVFLLLAPPALSTTSTGEAP